MTEKNSHHSYLSPRRNTISNISKVSRTIRDIIKKEDKTSVIILGSMKRGKRSTANRDRDVNALAGVRFPPSKVYIPNEITVTITGMLFSMKLLHYKTRK